MQRGFTNNSSAVNAALFISEALNESKDIGEPLKLVTLVKRLMSYGRIPYSGRYIMLVYRVNFGHVSATFIKGLLPQ